MQSYEGDHCESATNDSIKSAREVVPFIMDLIKPSQTIDVGYGLGGWLSVFKECDVPTTAAPMSIVHPKQYEMRQQMHQNLV
jgi:hypothetical protein